MDVKLSVARAVDKWKHRLLALSDGSAWFLILPFVALWFWFDPTGMKVMLGWLLHLPVLIGVCIILSRIVFPQIRLGELMTQVKAGSVAAAIVVFGLLLFVAMIIMTAAGWTK